MPFPIQIGDGPSLYGTT